MKSVISHKNKLGAGIYTIPDISRILGFSKSKVARYINLYWDDKNGKQLFQDTYSWSVSNNTKAVNFYVLIELFTFINLQERGFSPQRIFKTRNQIIKDLEIQYPFAFAGILTDGKKIWCDYMDSVVETNGTKQINFSQIIYDFAQRIDFNSESKMAERFYPNGKDKSIVIDPHHQFGMPIIKGTNINTEILYSMYTSGEPIKSISILYDLTQKEVNDAISYYKPKVA